MSNSERDALKNKKLERKWGELLREKKPYTIRKYNMDEMQKQIERYFTEKFRQEEEDDSTKPLL